MSARPRLLFISPQFLFPTDAGGKIRTTNVLRGMKGGSFEITLASPAQPEEAARHAGDLAAVCDRFVDWPFHSRGKSFGLRRLSFLLSSLPVAVASDRSAAGRAAIRSELSRGYDLVVTDFVHAAVLTPDALSAASVLFTHNVEAEIFARHVDVAGNPVSRAVWRDQWRKMARFERAALQRFDTVIAVSERDAEQFREHYGVSSVEAIPTAVDLDFFDFRAPPDGPPLGGTIVFTGSMNWAANIDGIEFFMDSVWPSIARAAPAANVVVVGRDPPTHLVARAGKRGLPWTFTGFVDDIRPHVHDAQVYAIPLRVGGGTRIKVYEAMAMGCPVVSTTIGVEGLPLEDGRHYLCADTADAFAAEVLRLLAEADLRERLAASARAYVEENFSAPSVARIFERICEQTVERRRVSVGGGAANLLALGPAGAAQRRPAP